MESEKSISDNVIAYSESEAAEILGVKPRTLADYRREGRLKGNYAVFGRNILYTPDHLRRILQIFTVGRKAA